MPNYFAYSPEQAELLPRHVRDELPAGHLCFLIHEVIEKLDLSRFDEAYSEEGQRAYNPRLMLKLWLYGFAVNVRSSRKLEQRVAEDLGFRFLAGGLRPDHKTLSEFLRRHGGAIEELFTQVLGWARQAGMVRWGRVAIDSTRIKAQASPDRLQRHDEQQVRQWRQQMEREDPDQDPGMEVSGESAERLRRVLGTVSGSAAAGKKESLTDPDARFLRERGGRFRLGYSGELAVSEDHFIVAVRVTRQAADNASLLPMVQEVERQCGGRPQQVLADSGFYSGDNLDVLEEKGIDGYVPDSNLAREINLGKAVTEKRPPQQATQRMRHKLRSGAGRRTYLQRKTMVEPVIGVLKEQRGMRQFLRVGLAAVATEMLLAAISYNLTHAYRLRQ